MKKPVMKTIDPLDHEVDFAALGRVRRNAFAGAGQRGGPSLLALWEMPQLDDAQIMLRRGRPANGAVRTSTAKSVRLPEAVWKLFEARARAENLGVHQAMRAALLAWLHGVPADHKNRRTSRVRK